MFNTLNGTSHEFSFRNSDYNYGDGQQQDIVENNCLHVCFFLDLHSREIMLEKEELVKDDEVQEQEKVTW